MRVIKHVKMQWVRIEAPEPPSICGEANEPIALPRYVGGSLAYRPPSVRGWEPGLSPSLGTWVGAWPIALPRYVGGSLSLSPSLGAWE